MRKFVMGDVTGQKTGGRWKNGMNKSENLHNFEVKYFQNEENSWKSDLIFEKFNLFSTFSGGNIFSRTRFLHGQKWAQRFSVYFAFL